jgi:lipopolysaccharide transport protein LptA
MTAPRAIRLTFRGEGQIDKMDTDGRTTIRLDAVAGTADAANKRVTADKITTFFNTNGNDLKRAEAVGDAELYVEPLTASAENYRTTVNSPRFDCDFFPTGNNVRLCVGAPKTRTVRIPTVPATDRGQQTMLADKLTAIFSETTKDVESLVAAGGAKFTELDRNAIASQMTFTTADKTIRIRGGEPTVWDSRARAKAEEIDWYTEGRRSSLRGGVSTTYYKRSGMGDSLPFDSAGKPVFATADTLELDHAAETAVYVGNARGWQDNSYVRSDKFIIQQKQGRFFAEGNVQSVIYNVKQTQNGRLSNVPVYATAAKMDYDRDANLIRYRDNVDIRQGTDRITSGVADIYLNKENELSRSVAENNVVLTQPDRKATGDWAQYTADDEAAILRGSPATVADAVNGSTQAAELRFYMRDRRVASEGKAKQGNSTGRIRSVYNVKPD